MLVREFPFLAARTGARFRQFVGFVHRLQAALRAYALLPHFDHEVIQLDFGILRFDEVRATVYRFEYERSRTRQVFLRDLADPLRRPALRLSLLRDHFLDVHERHFRERSLADAVHHLLAESPRRNEILLVEQPDLRRRMSVVGQRDLILIAHRFLVGHFE